MADLTIGSTTSSIILVVSSATAAILKLLPYDNIGGNWVPTVIFKGRPSMFHAFIVSLIFAFSGSFTALFLPNKPLLATLCRFYSLLSMVSTVVLLLLSMAA